MRKLNSFEKCTVSGGALAYDLFGTCYEIALSDYTLVLTGMLMGAGVYAGKNALGISRGTAFLSAAGIQALSYAYFLYVVPKKQCV